MDSELPLRSRVSTRLVLLLAVPFALCAALLVIFAVGRTVSERSYRTALAWSQHAAAMLDVEAAAQRFVEHLDQGPAAVDQAAVELELWRAHSMELATGFSAVEQAEEAELSNAIRELMARGAAYAARPNPDVRQAVVRFYAEVVAVRLVTRVAEEQRGSREFAARGRRVSRQVLVLATAGASLLFVLGLVICLRVGRRFTRSLAYLRAAATRLATGDLEGTIALPSRDELGELAGAFNAMAVELRGSMIHKSELERSIELRTRELVGAEDALRQAQKLDAIGRFAGGVAHDFNNLIAVIMANAEMLADELGPDHPARLDVDEILGASERAASLVRQILAFSRNQPRDVHPIAVNDVVSNLKKMFSRIIGEDIQLTTDLAPNLGVVNADVGQLEQVLTNLVVNARDAMPGGGRLTLATEAVELGAAEAGRVGVPAGKYVAITVADTGCGMDEETQARIFEPFFTTKVVGKGTGLGLATVFGIVKQSDGGITVESRPQHGTRFRIYLPHCDRAPAAPAIRARTAPIAGAETILVVEDDDRVRSGLVRYLESRGYHLLEASSGAAALALLAATGEPVQLMLTDLVMPGVNGVALAREVQERWPEIKVVFMSGYADHEALSNMKLRGDETFIGKPFRFETLVTLLRETLAARGMRKRRASFVGDPNPK